MNNRRGDRTPHILSIYEKHWDIKLFENISRTLPSNVTIYSRDNWRTSGRKQRASAGFVFTATPVAKDRCLHVLQTPVSAVHTVAQRRASTSNLV
jgi:hypothetical protein